MCANSEGRVGGGGILLVNSVVQGYSFFLFVVYI